MKRRAMVLLVVALGGGCASTRITSSDPNATISVDGRVLGRGSGEINRFGTPGTATVTVRNDSGYVKQVALQREFTLTTFLTGLITYGICLIACWEYPVGLHVLMPERGGFGGGWDAPPGEKDPWLQAPAGWRAKAATPQAPPPADPAGPADPVPR